MNNRELILLCTLNSALELTPETPRLSAEQVNTLAGKLDFDPQETLHLVNELKEAELVELHWPGQVSITGKGTSALRPSQPSVSLGSNAVYVGPGAQIGAGSAIGANAMAAGATRIQVEQALETSRVIADIIAAQQHLIRQQATLPTEAGDHAKALATEADAIRQEIQKPEVNKHTVEQRLDKAKGILEKLGGLTTAAASLKPALDVLHKSFEWLTAHLRSMGNWPSITL
jgi:hypothetical protein